MGYVHHHRFVIMNREGPFITPPSHLQYVFHGHTLLLRSRCTSSTDTMALKHRDINATFGEGSL